MLAQAGGVADTEIHRCSLADGTIAFQEKPCARTVAGGDDAGEESRSPDDRGASAMRDDAFDFVNPFDEPAASPMASEGTQPEAPSQDRAECEKTTRDAIDAIDLEMRTATYTREEGQEYLAELLELTQQLRACKQL